eukprot:4311819-Prymnesium_polylepis.1
MHALYSPSGQGIRAGLSRWGIVPSCVPVSINTFPQIFLHMPVFHVVGHVTSFQCDEAQREDGRRRRPAQRHAVAELTPPHTPAAMAARYLRILMVCCATASLAIIAQMMRGSASHCPPRPLSLIHI